MITPAANGTTANEDKLVLVFSHNIIEHLGLKLYQNKPTNVLAELVSNSWDADAEAVWIHLRTNSVGEPSSIIVADDGSGMDEGTLRTRYLVVGMPKRSDDPKTVSDRLGRSFMGRKGIGKLAPFGVARSVDLVTVSEGRATWLRFDYDAMRGDAKIPNQLARYEPLVLARNISLAEIDLNPLGSDKECFQQFASNIEKTRNSGTFVRASALTLKKKITPEALMQSLGRRFTVTLARPDFVVHVNDQIVEESHAFPEWELRLPSSGFETAVFKTSKGDRTVKFWVGFVASAAWSQEEAGVGIYAHGKIAQDRPYFFKVKGNEIFMRYMYGVVEADWVDELSHDAISTDRTSIDWDDEDFSEFHAWGAGKVKNWISTYEAHRKIVATGENKEIVDRVIAQNESGIRESEKMHLVELLSDVTPRLGKEAENKQKLVEATVRAWTHEPARKLIKKLWQEASQFDANQFARIVGELSDQLVPESLSLAVVFAQRVFALSQLEKHIALGNETQLQELLERFPWILDNSYEKFVPRRSLKANCEEAERNGMMPMRRVHLPNDAQYTKPDFVFLGATVTGQQDSILVVELKGPGATAGWPEFEQLNSYISFLASRFTSAKVEGILVAGSHDEGALDHAIRSVKAKKWNELLLRSRKDHIELIAALLAGSEADAGDARVQQICELGGDAVTGFLETMSQRDPALRQLVGRLGSKNKAPTSQESSTLSLSASPYEEDEFKQPMLDQLVRSTAVEAAAESEERLAIGVPPPPSSKTE